jgi:CRAL/TRIO domain
MMSTHYPQRSYKIMILNAPGFLNGAFAAVKSILSESTRAKIAMVPSNQTTAEMLQVTMLLLLLSLKLLVVTAINAVSDDAAATNVRSVMNSASTVFS